MASSTADDNVDKILECLNVAITIVRHGQTDANKANIIQGQLDSPLNGTGLKQATAAGIQLTSHKFTHVYSSDLKRAYQTAQGIVKENVASQPAGLDIQTDILLRERMYGEFEGKGFAERNRSLRASGKSLPEYTPPGAETCQQLRARGKNFFVKLTSFLKESLSETTPPDISVSTTPPCGPASHETQPGFIIKPARKVAAGSGPTTRSATRKYPVKSSSKSPIPRSLGRRKSEGKTTASTLVVASFPRCRTSLNNRPANGNKIGQLCNGSLELSSKDIVESTTKDASLEKPNSISNDEQTTPNSSAEVAGGDQVKGPVNIYVKASVLVVSHGGWIREFLKYLTSNTNIMMFDGSSITDKLYKTSPNTGLTLLLLKIPLSKSTHKDDRPDISCVYAHSRSHRN